MTDISPLVKGVMAVIGIAFALGQYPKLEHWARAQAVEAMEWKQELPDLFPEAQINGHKINEIVLTRESRFHRRELTHTVHRNPSYSRDTR